MPAANVRRSSCAVPNTGIPRARAPHSTLRIKQTIQSFICLDTYMLYEVYKRGGICVRNHCGAEPAGDTKPPGLVATVGGRDRAAAWYATADCVKAPASVARGRFRGIHG